MEGKRMSIIRFEDLGRGLFWVLLILGGAMNLSDSGTLPLLLIFALVAAPLVFPALRRRIRWRRVFVLSLGANLVLLGMFYWIVSFYDHDSSGTLADDGLWAVWPLGDFAMNGDLPQIYWLPLWILKGLLFGFMLESLLVLGQHVRANLAALTMPLDEPPEANQPPFGAAGASCLGCMVVAYLVTMPLLTLYPSRLTEWLVLMLYTIAPLSGAFVVLYFSGWYHQRPIAGRLFSIIWRSCVVFGITSLFVALVILALLILLFGFFGYYSRGQY